MAVVSPLPPRITVLTADRHRHRVVRIAAAARAAGAGEGRAPVTGRALAPQTLKRPVLALLSAPGGAGNQRDGTAPRAGVLDKG